MLTAATPVTLPIHTRSATLLSYVHITVAKHQIFCSDLLTFNVMKMGQVKASGEVNGQKINGKKINGETLQTKMTKYKFSSSFAHI